MVKKPGPGPESYGEVQQLKHRSDTVWLKCPIPHPEEAREFGPNPGLAFRFFQAVPYPSICEEL